MISETGVGWNNELETIYPSDEWWKNKKFMLVIENCLFEILIVLSWFFKD